MTDTYTVTPGSTVGSVRIGDLQVEITPKVGSAAVLFMLSFDFDPRSWRSHTARLGADMSLTEALAVLFLRLVHTATRPGLLHNYQQRDDTLATIRGRVRIADQIRLRSGLPLPTEVTYDDYTPDVLENQLLCSALRALGAQRMRTSSSYESLRRVETLFAGVSYLSITTPEIPEPHWTRLNERYKPAIQLARLILTGAGLEARAGHHDAHAVLVDMNAVFERFVRTALREQLSLSPSQFPPPREIKRRYLDVGKAVRLEPDLTWWVGDRCIFVGDCKYKRPTGSIPNGDVYQMLAYLLDFDLPEGWLIYASGETRERDLVIANAPRTVHVRTINAAAQPDRLLAEVAALAAELTAATPSTSVRVLNAK